MWIFWILILIALAVAVKLLMNGKSRKHVETPMDILQKRYARGEIDEEEFVRRRDRLQQ